MWLTGPCNKCEVGPQNFVEITDKQTDGMERAMKGTALNPQIKFMYTIYSSSPLYIGEIISVSIHLGYL